MLDGVGAAAKSARSAGSALPFLAMMFEADALAACVAHAGVAAANATCHDATAARAASGYGYAKIAAVAHAPARHVLWVDADAWFLRDPAAVFASGDYAATGAHFFPDFYRYFATDGDFWGRVRVEQASDRGRAASRAAPVRAAFAPGDWKAEAGLDSGLLAVDKARARAPLGRLRELAASSGDAFWRNASMGDKDLWKMAWILSGHDYALSPAPAVVGYFDPKAAPSEVRRPRARASDARGRRRTYF